MTSRAALEDMQLRAWTRREVGYFTKGYHLAGDAHYIECAAADFKALVIELLDKNGLAYRILNGTGRQGVTSIICHPDQFDHHLANLESEIKGAQRILDRRLRGLHEHVAEEDDELRLDYIEQLLQETQADNGRLIIEPVPDGGWSIQVRDDLSDSLVDVVTESSASLEDGLRLAEDQAEETLTELFDE